MGYGFGFNMKETPATNGLSGSALPHLAAAQGQRQTARRRTVR